MPYPYLSFQNIRVQACPFHKGFQRFFSYASIELIQNQDFRNQDLETYKEIPQIMAQGTKDALRRLSGKLIPSFGMNDLKRLGAPSKLFLPMYEEDENLTECLKCKKMSSCHLAYALDDNSPTRNLGPDGISGSKETRPFFSLNACTLDIPGTIYSLLQIVNGYSNMDQMTSFDFNIDYIRSTRCRVNRNMRIDFFGNFLPKSSLNKPSRLMKNIKSLVVLYPSETAKHFFEEIIKIDTGYSNVLNLQNGAKNKIIYSKKKYIQTKTPCPIACETGCPALVPQTDNCGFPYEKNNTQIMKIEACLHNTPGALLKLCRLICTRFKRTKGGCFAPS